MCKFVEAATVVKHFCLNVRFNMIESLSSTKLMTGHNFNFCLVCIYYHSYSTTMHSSIFFVDVNQIYTHIVCKFEGILHLNVSSQTYTYFQA